MKVENDEMSFEGQECSTQPIRIFITSKDVKRIEVYRFILTKNQMK